MTKIRKFQKTIIISVLILFSSILYYIMIETNNEYAQKALNLSEEYASEMIVFSVKMNILNFLNDTDDKKLINFFLNNIQLDPLERFEVFKKDNYRSVLCDSYYKIGNEKGIDEQIKGFINDHKKDILSEGIYQKFLYCVVRKKNRPSEDIRNIVFKKDIGKVFYNVLFTDDKVVKDRNVDFETFRDQALYLFPDKRSLKRLYDFFDKRKDLKLIMSVGRENVKASEILSMIDSEGLSLKEKTHYLFDYFIENVDIMKDDEKVMFSERFQKLDQIGDPLMRVERKISLAVMEYLSGNRKEANTIINNILDLKKKSELDFEIKYMNYLLSKYYIYTSQFDEAIKFAMKSGEEFREDLLIKIVYGLSKSDRFKQARHLIKRNINNNSKKIKAYLMMQKAKDDI